MSFLLSHPLCLLSLPLHGFIWTFMVQKVSHVPDQIPPPSVKGYLTHLFRCRPAGSSWKEILFVHWIWIPEWEPDKFFWGFSNHNFTKMLLSSETQTQCGKLKDYETLGYVEMLIKSDCTEWFRFWVSRISHASLYIDLGLVLRYKLFVITSKPRLF